MLRDARRAVVFAGAGVRWGRGPIALRDLAERAQIPVMTTPKAKGVFPEDHPLSLGVFGMGGHPSATAYLKEGVDVLIAVGNGLGDLATDGWTDLLKPQVALVQVDIEASRLGRSYPIDLGIGAPADLFLEQLTVRLPQASPLELPGISHYSPPGTVTCGDEGAIAPQRVLWELQQILPTDTIFSCDSGEHFVFATHYLRTNSADAHIAMTGLGSMGSSIPAAIGAKLARPHRMSAAICGDGCFAMNAFEISTAVAAGLPILVVVMNDGRLGMVEIGHRAVYGRAPAYPTNPLDVQAVALGLGAQSYLIQRPNEILTLGLPERLRAGPVVLDVHIDRTIRMPKRDRFDAFSGGGRKPSPRPLIN
jgi:acetolactate synthase-1/2/3 large subunit